MSQDHPTPTKKDSRSGTNPVIREESDRDLQRRLSLAAPGFEEHAFVHHRCRDELISRFDLLSIQPESILDLGAATGSNSKALATRFPGAKIATVESNAELLAQRGWRPRGLRFRKSRVEPHCASMALLPVGDDSIDLAFCNLSLARYSEPDPVLREIRRVLKPGGVFVFSTPGPDTLRELRSAWGEDNGGAHVAAFTDMHDIGDALGRAGFAEPVLDVDTFSVQYRRASDLWRDLTFAGARNSLPNRLKGLTGKVRFKTMVERLTDTSGIINITVEIVYGQCWGKAGRQTDAGGEVRIDPAGIGIRR